MTIIYFLDLEGADEVVGEDEGADDDLVEDISTDSEPFSEPSSRMAEAWIPRMAPLAMWKRAILIKRAIPKTLTKVIRRSSRGLLRRKYMLKNN
jgi:hypothetical protein